MKYYSLQLGSDFYQYALFFFRNRHFGTLSEVDFAFLLLVVGSFSLYSGAESDGVERALEWYAQEKVGFSIFKCGMIFFKKRDPTDTLTEVDLDMIAQVGGVPQT